MSDRLTTAEVARLAGVTTATVPDWVRAGWLPAAGRMPGGRGLGQAPWVFDRATVEAFVRRYHAIRQAGGPTSRWFTAECYRDDDALARALAARPTGPPRPRPPRGWVGITLAAEQLGTSPHMLRRMAELGWLRLAQHGRQTYVEPAGLRALIENYIARGVAVPPEWLTPREAADRLCVCVNTVERLGRAGHVRCQKFSRSRLLFHVDDVARVADDWPARGFSGARARAIYQRAKAGEPVAALAAEYGISVDRALSIARGETWRWATGHQRRRPAA